MKREACFSIDLLGKTPQKSNYFASFVLPSDKLRRRALLSCKAQGYMTQRSDITPQEQTARHTLKRLSRPRNTTQKASSSRASRCRSFCYNLFHSVSWLINLFLVALPYLLALLGQYLSPRFFLFPAYLGLAFPFLLSMVVLFLLFRLVRRQWRGFIFNFLLLALSWWSIRSYIPLHPTPSVIPPHAVKVLSLNCQAFAYEKHTADKPNPTLRYIKDSHADIVCLQEAAIMRDDSPYVSAKKITEYLPEYPYVVTRYAQGDRGTSLMLLSKFPVRNTRMLPLESTFNGGIAYTLDVAGRELTVFNLHLESFRLTTEDGTRYARLAREIEAIALKEQMEQKLGPAFLKRAKQADRVHVEIIHEKTPYILVCGDFNDTPISYAHQRIASGLIDAYASTGCGAGYSFTFKRLGFRIDHILHSRRVKSYNCKVDKSATISDHKPLSCFISLE